MSQDIRSFFSRTPKGNEKKVTESKSEIKSETKKRNRKRIVLDSDSDEEPFTKVSKIDRSPKGRPSPKKHKGKQESPKASKYFEVPKENIDDILGKAPVKRVQQPGPKVNHLKKTEPTDEFGSDDDFQVFLNEEDCFVEKGKKGDVVETKKEFHSPTQEKSVEEKKPQSKKHKIEDETEPEVPKKKPPEKNLKKASDDEKISVEKRLISPLGKNEESKHHSNSPKNEQEKYVSPVKKISPVKVLEIKNKQEHSRKGNEKRNTEITTTDKVPKLLSSTDKSASQEKYELWVEKYKPTSLKQIIGQQGEKSNVNKLLKWLRNWYQNHNGSQKLSKPSPWAKDDSGAYFKAALLSGSPGVGKTTTAHLVCKELNLDMVEFNASDTRSKKMLSDEVSELLSTNSLSQYVHGHGGMSRKHVLVMDEVDGMAGNEDRGGIQELISLIKNSKVPIICMCNDRNHPKIRSLVNYCFDLRFNKPRVDQIKGAMMSICFKEKLKIKPETLNEIVTATNQDIRLILNHLSVLAAKESNLEVSSKHIKLGPWDVLKKVFSEEDHKKMSIFDKSDLFFHDYSVAPLFVHENYLLVVPHSQKASTKIGKMELFSKAVSSLCVGDLMESAIRSRNAWSLLPVQAMFSSVIPGDVLEGHVGGQINFPAWFGKNSRRGKLDRLSQELQVHTRLKTSCNKEGMRLDYSRALRDEVAKPLREDGAEGVGKALAFLHSYDLLREDIDALTELNTWPGSHDPFSSVESKVKAAFTRAYNKAPVLTPFSITAPIKKGRGGMGEDYSQDVEEGDEREMQEDDEMTSDAMIVVKKKQERKQEKKTEKKVDKKSEASSSKPRKNSKKSKK